MPDVLLAEFVPTGAPSDFIQDLTGFCGANGGVPATLADDSDATGSNAWGEGTPADGEDFAEWVEYWSVTGPAIAGSISLVKVRGRARRDANCSAGTITDGPGAFAPQAISQAMAWYEWTLATDPTDGQPWTRAKILAYQFGFRSTLTTAGILVQSYVYVAEFRVQAWGPSGIVEPPPKASRSGVLTPAYGSGALEVKATRSSVLTPARSSGRVEGL